MLLLVPALRTMNAGSWSVMHDPATVPRTDKPTYRVRVDLVILELGCAQRLGGLVEDLQKSQPDLISTCPRKASRNITHDRTSRGGTNVDGEDEFGHLGGGTVGSSAADCGAGGSFLRQMRRDCGDWRGEERVKRAETKSRTTRARAWASSFPSCAPSSSPLASFRSPRGGVPAFLSLSATHAPG